MRIRRIAPVMLVVVINYAGSVAAQQATTTGNQSPSVIAGGNVTINYGGMSSEEKAAFAKQVAETLLAMKVNGAPQVGPGAEQRVEQAVTGIAKGASEGDEQLQQALSLLAAGNVAQATPLLKAVADNKTARIQKDRKEAATAYRNLGAIAGLRDPKAALDAYAKAVELDPDDAQSLLWAGWLEVGHGELSSAEARLRRVLSLTAGQDRYQYWVQVTLADIGVRRGNLPGALKSYRDSLAIAERLAKAHPGIAEWQRDLSVSYNKVGDVLKSQGDLAGALKSYRDSLAIAERLAKVDPGNAEWQRDLSVLYNKVGDVLKSQGDLAGALKPHRDSLAIAERLAKVDPGNTEWQRDLSVSYNKVGGVLESQGDLAGALKSYRDDLAIAERLAKADPGNAQWQRDLSVSYNKVGGVLEAQGDLAGALKSYRDSLAIRERLAKAHPGNAQWQFDVVVSNWQLASAGDEAVRRWTLIVTTLRGLSAANKLTIEQTKLLPVAEKNLAKLKKR